MGGYNMNKDMLATFINKVVKVDRGGPESGVGKLLHVSEDHFTLLTENDGVVYYKMQHIKSLTHNAKKEITLDVAMPESFELLQTANFNSLLKNLRYHWVRINRGGPEKLEGVLDDIADDYVVIVANEEVIQLSLFHIRSISYGPKVEKQKEEKTDESKEKKEKSKDEQSSNKKEEKEQNK